ncbi:MAG: bifunctional 4-hydroxy-3-methylbut-2-enyl diphosphate reductase/30S ribosomal protein S1 [Clostridiales bacterium]|nr:bifunctional 4-hydroxy-3-methylbut-2-enyl diphosphate reductase/30S ribosomal protein S1 [Clostridiales bacterium]
MQIKVAETAGFCFGVNRAVNYVYERIEQGEKLCTLGPIIHNKQVVADLAGRGVYAAKGPNDVRAGYSVVIRTHGVEKSVTDALESRGIAYNDLTCPFVLKIHKIVMSAPEGTVTLIAGDESHPEVKGIRSRCVGKSYVFSNEEQLKEILKNLEKNENASLICVSQTTFDKKILKNCLKLLKKVCTNCEMFDTICNATSERQAEASDLSNQCDAMVVIGGRHSSNTCKLKDVCSQNAPTFHIESAAELAGIDFTPYKTVGVTAGASTPSAIIKEVLKTMSEEIKEINEKEVEAAEVAAETAEAQAQSTETSAQANAADIAEEAVVEADADGEASFAEMLEESMRDYVPDKVVKGTVVNITPTEVYVDVPRRKQAGIIQKEDLSFEDFENCSDVVSVGDEIDLIIMKVDDQSGTLKLSKRLVDRYKVWNDIYSAKDTGEVLEGVVTGAKDYGVFVKIKGAGIFVPSPLTGLRRGENNAQLLGQTVRLIIIEINKAKQRAVGSIKAVLAQERRAAAEAMWDTFEEGMTLTGTVKSLTQYGAFVDVGGIVGLIHISEISWAHIKHPSDVLEVGQEVQVTVISANKEKNKLSLRFKKFEDSPWEIMKRDYTVGAVVDVKIVRLTDFGAFAEVIPGIDGLIHISQISLNRIKSPHECLSVGDVVAAKIVEIDYDRKRVGLSIKALLQEKEQETIDAEREEIEKYLLNQNADEEAPAEDAVADEAPAETEEAPAEDAQAE